jgi:replicative DNA helicase
MEELLSGEVGLITTGINRLDFRIKGFPVGCLSLIGGKAASGKTTLAVNIAATNFLNGNSGLYITDGHNGDIRKRFIKCLDYKCGGDGLKTILESKTSLHVENSLNDRKNIELIETYGENVKYIIIDGGLYEDTMNYDILAKKYDVSIILIRVLRVFPENNNTSRSEILTKKIHKYSAAVMMALERDTDMAKHNYANINVFKNRSGCEVNVEINFNPQTFEIS